MISIVTPAYNVSRQLPAAYACLCRQTFTSDWEWVIVDDGSTDDTLLVIKSLAEKDARIRYASQANSGSAKQPRDHAVYLAKGEHILMLDADDTIADDYLEKMANRMNETDADIVYPRLVMMQNGERKNSLPVSDFNTETVYEGRNLVRYTLPDWQIGCNGGLYRRHVWVRMSYPPSTEQDGIQQRKDCPFPLHTFSDEVDERHYLLQAYKVSFTDAEYYYTIDTQSVSHIVSPRAFDALLANQELRELIGQTFGQTSPEYQLLERKCFVTWRNLLSLYCKHKKQLDSENPHLLDRLKSDFQLLSPRALRGMEHLTFFRLCSFNIIYKLLRIKYKDTGL